MLWDWIVTFINWIIKALASVAKLAVQILPKSPFAYIDNSPIADYIGYLNWIIPVEQMISLTSTWLFAITLYYSVSTLLRWVKVIE